MKIKKILCLFDYKARTGFGTVSQNIVKEIKKNFGSQIKLDIVAINYFGENYFETDDIYVTSARNNDVNDDPFGRFYFLKILKESNEYDGIFIMQDIGIIVPFVEVLEHIKAEKKENNRKNFKSIFYFPIDCKIIPQITENLPFFDVLVTYTEFGRKEILRHKPELKSKIKVVPHGNNPKEFYPIADISEFRSEYFGENANKFIITNVNRNQPRKDLVSTIFGFINALESWDDDLPQPFLYLHCHPQDPLGWDLRAVFMQTELIEDVHYKLLPREFEDTMVETEMVNKIYNASDVFITTTLGEGWGLSVTEAMATKTPIICPYNTSLMEMTEYGKNAFVLKTMYPYCNNNDNAVREQVDIWEVSDAILMVARAKYGNYAELKKDLQEKVERSYAWVNKLSWDKVCKSWVEYFKIY
jgi:glycosyltransferase involved in cell wall biosynthesis